MNYVQQAGCAILMINFMQEAAGIMETYSTLIEAINGLKAKGYKEDFNLK
jgi:hypothetical protein